MQISEILAYARAHPSVPHAPLGWALAMQGATRAEVAAAATEAGHTWDALDGTLARRLTAAAAQMPTDLLLIRRAQEAQAGRADDAVRAVA